MLGRILAVTLNVPDLPGTIAAYERHLGYRVVADGALGREVARGWGRPALAARRAVTMEPASGADTWLRLVQGPSYPDYAPLACSGWNAAELVVEDVDALARGLGGSPFRIVGPPADLSFSADIRAMQVAGPAQELLYLTQIKAPLPQFDTPRASSFVDRVFIVILGGPSLAAIQDFYHQRFGLPRAPVMTSAVSTLSARYGLPADHRHSIAALALAGQCYIEADEMPAGVAARPCLPGELPPGIALVTFEVDHLPAAAGIVAGQAPAPPYGGRPACLCVGAAGELVELVARG
jgi:catechol 2,3-dioxygenase-like lactoylglutathione lyase family enzyme